MQKWGDSFPKGQVFLDGNIPKPSWDDLKKLNGKPQHAVNALAGRDGPVFRQTLGYAIAVGWAFFMLPMMLLFGLNT